MAKSLVLAEKPSVARDLARVLGCAKNGDGCIIGAKYIVTWALGHLVTLADPESYDDKYKTWSLETLPMLPEKMKLTVIKQTSKQFGAVSRLLKSPDVNEIIIATDAGREGELVARWIIMKAGVKKPMKRLWISSQTDKAVREGFASLRPAAEYDNLYRSAEARAQADWYVGLNVTRALTCKYNDRLSAGRVQTPTLAMIVRREKEIREFIPKDYYTVRASFAGFNGTFRDKKGNTRFSDIDFAQGIVKSCAGAPAIVSEIKKAYKQTPPPAAYDLTELQRDANKKYGFSAKYTLDLMQSLYETHKVLTYPRTDSRYITSDVALTLKDRLKAVNSGAYRDSASALIRSGQIRTKYIVNDAKVTDHHAIIPTEEPADFMRMGGDEKKIYDLVVRRFLAVLSAPYEYDETSLKLTVGKNEFFAKGNTVRTPGWKAAYGTFSADDGEEDTDFENRSQELPELKQGGTVKIREIKVVSGKTKPPARYTEATLLSAMEHPTDVISDKALRDALSDASGLGTPATRADIIEKLFANGSVVRNGREIRPTPKGEQLIKLVPADLRSAELTARWEQQLQNIGKGKADMKKFIGDMKKFASALVSEVIASDAQYKYDNMTREKCPQCGKYLLEVNGKRGKSLVCPDRECGYRKGVSQISNARCPDCFKKMELRGEGDKKVFICTNCGHRERLSDFQKRHEDNSRGAGRGDVEAYRRRQKEEEKKAAASASPFADLMKMFEK